MHKMPIVPGNPKIIQPIISAHIKKECSVCFELNMILRPGEGIVLEVPDKYRSKILDLITIAHRKVSRPVNSKWDPEPAYSRVLVLDIKTKTWKYWGAKQFPAVSFGDKLAEPREVGNPEVEALHDWVAYSGKIFPRAICILNSGKGERSSSFVHDLTVDFFPDDIVSKQTFIFSSGTAFSDLKKKTKEQFGGGESYKGQYPHAVTINSNKKPQFPVSEKGSNYFLENNCLHIIVDHEYTFSRIEVAIGDTKDTGEFNKDGHFGALGAARLTIKLERKGQMYVLAQDLNVPPQGVLKASPTRMMTVSKGDHFIISAEHDPAYVMGVRIQ